MQTGMIVEILEEGEWAFYSAPNHTMVGMMLQIYAFTDPNRIFRIDGKIYVFQNGKYVDTDVDADDSGLTEKPRMAFHRVSTMTNNRVVWTVTTYYEDGRWVHLEYPQGMGFRECLPYLGSVEMSVLLAKDDELDTCVHTVYSKVPVKESVK